MSQYALAALYNQSAHLHQRLSKLEAIVSKLEFDSTAIGPIKHHVDPSPVDYTRTAYAGDFASQAQYGPQFGPKIPGWFTDPAPEDIFNVKLVDVLRRWKGGFTDPAPDELSRIRLKDLVAVAKFPIPIPYDPSPEDFGRLSHVELEATLHRVNADLVRLKSLERMLQDQLKNTPSHAST